LSFAPKLSPRIERIRFPLTVRDQVLDIEVNHSTAAYRLRQGDDLVIWHQGQEVHLTADAPEVKMPVT
jgi:alpha,alpha-trehalose phosphorylase